MFNASYVRAENDPLSQASDLEFIYLALIVQRYGTRLNYLKEGTRYLTISNHRKTPWYKHDVSWIACSSEFNSRQI